MKDEHKAGGDQLGVLVRIILKTSDEEHRAHREMTQRTQSQSLGRLGLVLTPLTSRVMSAFEVQVDHFRSVTSVFSSVPSVSNCRI